MSSRLRAFPAPAAALAALLLAAGCPATSAELAGDDGDDDVSPGGVDCEVDADCGPAGSSCCECPTFALPEATGWQDSCGEVDCTGAEPSGSCPLTEAVCELGACVLRCEAIACDASCPGGFSADAFGCLVCDCADPSPPADQDCAVDADCVQVAADCCGCENGGTDTAVPAGEADAFNGELGCDADPICPGVDTCDPTAAPRCVGGFCTLVSEPGTGLTPDAGVDDSPADPQYCGDEALPPCPAGLDCVLNHPDYPGATSSGLGVCLAR